MTKIRQLSYKVYRFFRSQIIKGKSNDVRVLSKKKGHFRLDICGNNNQVIVDKDVYLLNASISINGNNNIIKISENCRIYSLTLHISGDCGNFIMGNNVGIREADIQVQEGRTVSIGDDSMLSYGIHIRTSDSHKIFNLDSGERINAACDVIVGEHCWIAQNATLLKGSKIGNHSIVGFGSICSKAYPAHCIIVGIPGRVIKENVGWSRVID